MVYKRVDGGELTADVYVPAGAGSGRACVGFFHGGGWVSGTPSEYGAVCAWHAQRGYVAVSFSYRLSVCEDGSYPHPSITPVEATLDARDALRWLHARSDELGIARERIVVGGQSAGGQLAMGTVLCDKIDPAGAITPRPRGIILHSGNHNMVEAWVDNLLGERRGEVWLISSYHNLYASMPPVCAFHGGKDTMVPPYVVELFRKRMAELGNRYDLHWYADRGHYLGAPEETYAKLVDEEILQEGLAFIEGVI